MKEKVLNQDTRYNNEVVQEKVKQEVGGFIGRVFDNYKNKEERYKYILSVARKFFKIGVLDEQIFTVELEEISKIGNKDEFISKMLMALEPVLKMKTTNPKLLEQVQAEIFTEQNNYIKLNEVLSYGISYDSAHIHLAPSKELLREIGKEGYLNLVSDGFKKLAKIVEKDEKIKKITATSTVVVDNPNRMAEFGFIIKGPISEEHRNKHWKGDERNIGEAEMSRERLLEYLKK